MAGKGLRFTDVKMQQRYIASMVKIITHQLLLSDALQQFGEKLFRLLGDEIKLVLERRDDDATHMLKYVTA